MGLILPTKKTSHPPELLTQRLVHVLRLFDKEATQTLGAQSGLRILDWRILAALAVESPMTVRGLAESLFISRSEASRSAAVLLDKALVLRQQDEEDRRSVWFFITGKGREIYDRVMPQREAFMKLVTDKIPREDRACFDRVLDQLTAHLEEITK